MQIISLDFICGFFFIVFVSITISNTNMFSWSNICLIFLVKFSVFYLPKFKVFFHMLFRCLNSEALIEDFLHYGFYSSNGLRAPRF